MRTKIRYRVQEKKNQYLDRERLQWLQAKRAHTGHTFFKLDEVIGDLEGVKALGDVIQQLETPEKEPRVSRRRVVVVHITMQQNGVWSPAREHREKILRSRVLGHPSRFCDFRNPGRIRKAQQQKQQ